VHKQAPDRVTATASSDDELLFGIALLLQKAPVDKFCCMR